MFAQLLKQVLLVLCCCFCIGSCRLLNCNDLVTKVGGVWTFTLHIPVSYRSYIALTKVRVSWEQTAMQGAGMSVLRRSRVNENMITVTYVIRPPNTVRSKPHIADIVLGTGELCILYCEGKPEVRPNMVSFNISREENLHFGTSNRPNCTEYIPLYSPLPENCGIALRGRILDGDEVEQGTWPWLVPIYIKDKGTLRFKCGGSIISSRTILTAAHCLRDESGNQYKEHVVKIFAGRHNLTDFNEGGYTSHNAKEIIVHPQYNGGHLHNIGLINLETEIIFTEKSRPVCLWNDTASLGGNLGTVAGWGLTQLRAPSPVPYRVVQIFVTPATCKLLNPIYLHLDLSSTICTVGQDGGGPCKGDSGGGLILEDQNKRFSVRGLVSMTQQEEQSNKCDPINSTLYTDVAQYYHWIRTGMW